MTDSTLEAVEPSGLSVFFSAKELQKMARREYQDPPLRKTKGANPRWYIRIRKRHVNADGEVSRKQTREYLGFCSDLPAKAAQRERQTALRRINSQIYSVSSQVSLQRFVVVYNEKHIPTLGAGTQKKYRFHLANHIVPRFGEWKLTDVSTEEIQGFLNDKKAAGLSWWTRNDLRNILSSLFTKAKDFGYWRDANPVEPTTCGRKEAKREKRLLSDEQVLALLHELPAFLALIVRIADSTGLRVSEILGLKWENVDLELGWIEVVRRWSRGDLAQPKSDAARRSVPLGDLAGEMRDWHAYSAPESDSAFVFRDQVDQPYDDRNLNQHYLRPIAKRLGFYWQGFGFHSFRRGQITGVQSLGASSIEASKMAGHSRPQMTAEYTHMEKKRREDLVRMRQDRLKNKTA